MINAGEMTQNQHSSHELAADLTPLLDILFILLVFFLLTAGSVFPSLDLVLPESVSEDFTASSQPKNIVLELHKGFYRIDGEKISSFDLLKNAIPDAIKQKPGHEFIIAGDKDVTIEKLLQILTYLQSKNIATANILMQQHSE